MRIGSYNMISQIYGNSGAKKTKSSGASGQSSFADQVMLSSAGKDMQTAKSALANVSDVREAKINDIKSRMDAGTYDVDVDDFAQKLLDTYAARSRY